MPAQMRALRQAGRQDILVSRCGPGADADSAAGQAGHVWIWDSAQQHGTPAVNPAAQPPAHPPGAVARVAAALAALAHTAKQQWLRRADVSIRDSAAGWRRVHCPTRPQQQQEGGDQPRCRSATPAMAPQRRLRHGPTTDDLTGVKKSTEISPKASERCFGRDMARA